MANAGGVINVYSELAGWTSARSFRKADEIYDTVLKVFEIAKTEKIPTYLAADRLAEQRIRAVDRWCAHGRSGRTNEVDGGPVDRWTGTADCAFSI